MAKKVKKIKEKNERNFLTSEHPVQKREKLLQKNTIKYIMRKNEIQTFLGKVLKA